MIMALDSRPAYIISICEVLGTHQFNYGCDLPLLMQLDGAGAKKEAICFYIFSLWIFWLLRVLNNIWGLSKPDLQPSSPNLCVPICKITCFNTGLRLMRLTTRHSCRRLRPVNIISHVQKKKTPFNVS